VPNAVSPDEFIATAVREKLSLEGQKGEFCRLSNQTRAAMAAKGLTESPADAILVTPSDP
jgi:hypothetical protein